MKASTSECKAKDPSTCPYHGSGNSAEGFYQSYLKSKRSGEQPGVPSKSVVGLAVESSMHWNGKKPKWWKKYCETVAADTEVASTPPELLDVIDSPVGPLAVVWQQQSQESGERFVALDSGMGTNICYYKSVKTGETLGYLKLSYMDDGTLKRSFGDDELTPFRYRARYGRGSYSINYSEEEGKDYETILRETWVDARRDLMRTTYVTPEGEHIESRNLSIRHAPDVETIKKELNAYVPEIKRSIDEQRSYFAEPFVDYSRVNGDLKGKGFGAALYVYGARKLGENGQVLRASGIQSEDAQALWGKFKKLFPKNVGSLNLTYQEETKATPTLDFRR